MLVHVDSTDVRRQWAERSGEFSPAYYAYYGPDERSESVLRILDQFVDRDGAVLELGCSSGRHLSHLHEDGFGNLTGIEVNGDAFDVMAEAYPALAAHGTFYHAAIEDVVGEFADGRFDAVYSVETLQHIHPDVEWIFAELARITDELLVTVENEGERGDENETRGRCVDESDRSQSSDPAVRYVTDDVPLYYRNWNRVFTEAGLVEVDVAEGGRDTIRTFRSPRE